MIIRKLTPADAEAYRELRLAGILNAPAAFWAGYDEESTLPLEAMQARLEETPYQSIFGLFSGEKLLGMAALKRESIAKISHRATIWGVYVDPSARGTGAARRLVDALIAHARTLPELVQLTLSVRSTNETAIALYAKVGFEATGVDRRSMYVDNAYHDENRMVLMLDA
ncbi:GNAT family N-acetyltransferase [Janthinobacterium fluminis]|uniref:GNAT family N-acetyltransferase n=1 Tax=Janthinobacterium fluminis TaxID=2987524 RepID=A0ABT5JXL0_9BURK|nr:GNAT family N-acetyltransferase [Janthinobacterium fluminis]MDC8757471.1 GNAT family N-acetyltransferase [Janthinobacterium fluminis]